MSSLVSSFRGSAIMVLTIPKLNGSSPPNRLARLAPTRSWMRAEPLRSIHSKRTVTCRQISRATSAVQKLMSTSISCSPRVAGGAGQASVPFQCPNPPDIGEPHGQDPHERRHLRETEPTELAVGHRPRVHEHDLDIEDDEEDGREVELHRKPGTAQRADRRVAGLEDLVLHLAAAPAAEDPAHEQQDRRHEPAQGG